MTVYTQEGCSKCLSLKLFMTERNIGFDEIDVHSVNLADLNPGLIYLPILRDGNLFIQGLIPSKEYLVATYGV